MDVNLDYAGVELAAGRYLVMRDAKGTRVLCLAGELWITQDGDNADYFLQPGETFAIGVRGSIVVQAHRAARLLLLEPVERHRPGWLDGWLGPARIDAAPPLLVRLHGA